MEGIGLALLYPARALGHYGYPRPSVLILRKSLRGTLGHQITDTTARPFFHLLKSNSQTSAGFFYYQAAQGLTEAIPSEPPSLARPDRRATGAEKDGRHPGDVTLTPA